MLDVSHRRPRRRPAALAATALATAVVAAGLVVVSAAPSQAVTIDTGAHYVLTSRHSGKAVDVFDFATNDGAPIVQWARNDGYQQQWQFVPVDNGYYQVRSRHSGKVLQIASAQDGAELTQQDASSDTRQHFGVVDTGDGHIRLVNRHSRKALDVWEWSTADGGRVSQYTDLDGWNQQWLLTRIGGPSVPYSNVPDGFAQGVTGGTGGQTVTVTNQADLNRYTSPPAPRTSSGSPAPSTSARRAPNCGSPPTRPSSASAPAATSSAAASSSAPASPTSSSAT
ncbi:RICIN domain-containing protein [Polymorphospora sp. NPDC050346]|uniref:RICIN domain-containing protein n=1 Tax=Polymorphospora sp. NPDC050346 TaxID=3155780 RepID=UPI0033CD9970